MGFETVARETNFALEGLRLLRRHKLLLVIGFLVPAAIGSYLALSQPSLYSASSSVLIETSGKDVVTLKEVLADVPADAEAISSEIEVLSSREMLERTAAQLSLVDDREFNPALHQSRSRQLLGMIEEVTPAWATAFIARAGTMSSIVPSFLPTALPTARPMNAVVDSLRRHLLIISVGRSRVIQITCTSLNPATAAAIVNTLAQLYTEEHLRLRNDATQQANQWIDARVANLRARADHSAAAVEQYRVEHGLVRGRDSLLIQQELTEVSSQLTAAQARRSQADVTLANAEQARASGQPDRIGAVVGSALIQQLRQQEAQITAHRADIDAQLGFDHPAAVSAAAQMRSVQGQIGAETGRIVQSLREKAEVARADEAAISAHLDQVRQEVDKANTFDVKLQQLQRESDVDSALYQTFLTRSKETDPEFNFQTVNVRVLSQAVPPDRPVAPNRPLIAISGIIVGLIMGIMLAITKDLLGRGLRTRADVEKLFGASPIGLIPYCHPRASAIQQIRLQESVASLWARVTASAGGKPPRSVLITSAVMSEGKTTLARLLGTVAANQGKRVLIIDGDLRCSSLTAQINRTRVHPGLAELIRNGSDLATVTVADGDNVHILPAGDCGGNPVRMLASPVFATILREAEKVYDLVIVDSPPALIGADASLLGSSVEATILVARWQRTPQAAVEAALNELATIGVRCVGVALTNVDTRRLPLYDPSTSLSVSHRARRQYANLVASK